MRSKAWTSLVNVALDPVGKRRIGKAGERDDDPAKDLAVGLEVVAAQPRERTRSAGATLAQCGNHDSERGTGRLRVC